MDFEKVNDKIRTKTSDLKARLRKSINALGIKHVDTTDNYEALKNITTRTSQQFGVINRIRIKFKRSGVFVHKGVGRGVTAAQAGSSNTTRKAKEWFNPVVEEFAQDLASEVADDLVDITFNSIKIK